MSAGFSPRFFDPAKLGKRQEKSETVVVRANGSSYAYSTRITLAINVALATSRPIYIVGAPGTGKTTLARNAAHVLGWRYYKYTVTSRTKAKDLMWSFDSLRRLSHAQEQGRKELPPRAAYVQPHALWWAFDPRSARQRGATAAELKKGVTLAKDTADTESPNAVVLLDEIDKADPDVPNDLLEVLDERRFTVDELDVPTVIEGEASRLLVMITSNRERDMPPAFLRRCVVLVLDDPNADWLVAIANDRFGAGAKKEAFHRALANKVMEVRREAQQQDARGPSTAEYLNAVEACSKLDIGLESPMWQQLSDTLLRKREQPPEQPAEQAD